MGHFSLCWWLAFAVTCSSVAIVNGEVGSSRHCCEHCSFVFHVSSFKHGHSVSVPRLTKHDNLLFFFFFLNYQSHLWTC